MKIVSRNRRGRRRSGSAILDLALAMPVMLAIAFGVCEYGYYFFTKHNIQAAAREGARAAIVPSSTMQNVSDAVLNVMKASGLDKTGYSVSVTDTNGAAINFATVTSGTAINVTVQCTWGSVGVHPLPEIMGGMAPTKPVKGSTVMRREG